MFKRYETMAFKNYFGSSEVEVSNGNACRNKINQPSWLELFFLHALVTKQCCN